VLPRLIMRLLALLLALAAAPTAIAETTFSDNYAVLGLPSPVIALRMKDGTWRPGTLGIIIGIESNLSLWRFQSGLEQVQLVVDLRQATLPIPRNCRRSFVLEWPRYLKQMRRDSSGWPWPASEVIAGSGNETTSGQLAQLSGPGCKVDLLMELPSEKYEPKIGIPFSQLSLQRTPVDYGSPLGRGAILKFGELRIRSGDFAGEAIILVEHLEPSFALPSRLGQLLLFLLSGLIITRFSGMVVGRLASDWTRLVARLFQPSAWKYGLLAGRLFITASFSRVAVGSSLARFNSFWFRPHLIPTLEPLITVPGSHEAVIFVSATWATPKRAEVFREFTRRVNQGLNCTTYVFWWPGLNSEAQRIRAARALAREIESTAGLGACPKIKLVGFSHGGTVARHCAERYLSRPGLDVSVSMLAAPIVEVACSVDLAAFQPYFFAGAAMRTALPAIALIGGGTLYAVSRNWMEPTTAIVAWIPPTIVWGIVFYAYAVYRSKELKAVRQLLNEHSSVPQRDVCLQQFAFVNDPVLGVFDRVRKMLMHRAELEAALGAQSAGYADPGERRLSLLIALEVVCYLVLVWFAPDQAWAAWGSRGVFLFGGAAMAAWFASFVYYLIAERSQHLGFERPQLGASLYAVALVRVARLVGLPGAIASNYRLNIDTNVDIKVPEVLARPKGQRTNLHSELIEASGVAGFIRDHIRQSWAVDSRLDD
jgi:hypothetical protein